MRNIFLEKSYRECGGETNPRPFSETLKLGYVWINGLKFYTVYFYLYAKLSAIKIYKLSCRPHTLNSY